MVGYTNLTGHRSNKHVIPSSFGLCSPRGHRLHRLLRFNINIPLSHPISRFEVTLLYYYYST